MKTSTMLATEVVPWDAPGYTAVRELGSGGFGDVMLARHDASGTLVAIKYLRHELLEDPGFAGMFRAEAAALAALADPNVVRLYEYIESPAGAAIVMELVDGVSLREILSRQGKTTAEAALMVLRGSLLGLAAAHARGVVHRDYKPENVLVNGVGVSKLTDFGIAARAGDRPMPAGTLAYAPPEQFTGAPASPASDVYAATATFYECLTGHPPFSGPTAEVLLRQHQSEPVPLDPVPGPLRPLVTAGMAKKPGERPADAGSFVTALDAAAVGAYGEDWEDRGRSRLAEAALLLAALWPSGAAPAAQGTAVEQVNLSHGAQASSNAQASTNAQASQQSGESRHLWHLKHVRHLLHLEHLRRLQVATAVAVATAVVAAGAAVAITSGSSHGSGGPGSTAAVVHPAVPEDIPVGAASGLPAVTGDVYVEYQEGRKASARISGKISHAFSGEVVRLYAQQFPYASAPAAAGSTTLRPAGGTASYTFSVTPTLATRYRVELFRDSAATTPLGRSAVSTIYVVDGGTGNLVQTCNRPDCTLTYTWTTVVPAQALPAEMAKQSYLYFGINFSTSGTPAPPTSIQLGAGDPVIVSTQRISADEFKRVVTYTVQINNDGFNAGSAWCTKDTEAQDGMGLPSPHSCGDATLPYPNGYLG